MSVPWLTVRMVSGAPVRLGTLCVTPYARVVRLSVPGRAMGWVWMRPGPVEVAWDSGATQWLEVRDLTREVLWGLAALCAAAGVWRWLARRLAR